MLSGERKLVGEEKRRTVERERERERESAKAPITRDRIPPGAGDVGGVQIINIKLSPRRCFIHNVR